MSGESDRDTQHPPEADFIYATARRMPGDGDCLFHCLADQRGPPTEQTGASTRRTVGGAAMNNTDVMLPTGQTLGQMMTKQAHPERTMTNCIGRAHVHTEDLWRYGPILS